MMPLIIIEMARLRVVAGIIKKDGANIDIR